MTLWDLSVNGMHSFVANGIVVSNTALEAGGSRQAPAGVFAISIAEMRGGLEKALEQKQAQRWAAKTRHG